MSGKCIVAAVVLLAMLPSAAATAQDDDQEINIQADNWDADRRAGRATYRGNVIVTSGGLELRGDELVLEFVDDALHTMRMTGSPARFSQRHDGGRDPTEAQAERLVYETESATVRLLGEVRVVQGRDEYASDDLRYDIREGRVVAGGEGAGRVQVTIQPRRGERQDPERER